ncbi:GntR family transcriptional regulator [Leifsonia sp. Root227]|jgi:GntR family transcriptional regulator|uniref:GntR family transcriptional regulator n=1 Tax=unclassified Leifsonia TaxID=2663824 RepID=UPI0006F9314C|nr:GntR family transcriptional regulator [Leifsonia sp. Root227]KRC51054.1 GntR family transcriptional regulator [Leifsonia sp. Root227]
MLIRLEAESAASFAEQIVAQVRLGVARGEIRVGERLPSARELAGSLGVNMHTVLRAYDDLREAGVIDLRRGRGAVVVAGDTASVRSLIEAAASLVSEAARAGISSNELSVIIRGIA